MTHGSFFVHYTASCLLHCGDSNYQGLVYNLDQDGYRLEHWPESFSVPLEGISGMDAALAAHDTVHRDCSEAYRTVGHNCFDYAVSFLNRVRFRGQSGHTRQTTERDLLAQPFVLALQHLLAVAPALQQLQAASYGALCEHIRAGQARVDTEEARLMPPPPAKKRRPDLELELATRLRGDRGGDGRARVDATRSDPVTGAGAEACLPFELLTNDLVERGVGWFLDVKTLLRFSVVSRRCRGCSLSSAKVTLQRRGEAVSADGSPLWQLFVSDWTARVNAYPLAVRARAVSYAQAAGWTARLEMRRVAQAALCSVELHLDYSRCTNDR
jgi:hypothetical protein